MSTEPHIIKNFEALATTPQRNDALTILEAGLEAIHTKAALTKALKYQNGVLSIDKETYDLNQFKKVLVIGIGKSAIEAAEVLEEVLGDRISEGIILDTRSATFKHLTSLVGTHPLPSPQNVAAAYQIAKLLKGLTPEDLIIAIISGGGSALLCQPYQVDCGEVATITQTLMKKGADIRELNTVRKHLSEILGGQFAEQAYPAQIIGLIFSDIPNNDLSLVASGPTYLDKTTVADAAEVLAKYEIMNSCQLPNCNLKETTKDEKYFEHVHNYLIVSNQNAAKAMQEQAEHLGYKSRIKSTELAGNARDIAKELAQEVSANEAIIASGETTVIVTHEGIGGRNQELVLSAFDYLKENSLILSCASDGVDNTPIAGALADRLALENAHELLLSSQEFLERNHSYEFFRRVGTGIKTGPTGANVSDLMLVLGEK